MCKSKKAKTAEGSRAKRFWQLELVKSAGTVGKETTQVEVCFAGALVCLSLCADLIFFERRLDAFTKEERAVNDYQP